MTPTLKLAGLFIEFLLLFFALPAFFAYTRHRIAAIPALWALTAYCLFILLRDPGFSDRRLWNMAALPAYILPVLALFAPVAVIGIVAVWRFAPRGLLLHFPRSKPRQWGLLLVLYPLLSVYPQGIVYRAFVFERYRALFGPPWAIMLASCVAFTYAHVIYRNWLALCLTFLGGWLFAFRYWQSGSLMVSTFEHALYGCALFTLGLGEWFHHAAQVRASKPAPAASTM